MSVFRKRLVIKISVCLFMRYGYSWIWVSWGFKHKLFSFLKFICLALNKQSECNAPLRVFGVACFVFYWFCQSEKCRGKQQWRPDAHSSCSRSLIHLIDSRNCAVQCTRLWIRTCAGAGAYDSWSSRKLTAGDSRTDFLNWCKHGNTIAKVCLFVHVNQQLKPGRIFCEN